MAAISISYVDSEAKRGAVICGCRIKDEPAVMPDAHPECDV
jgi:hypothetical protein